MKYNLVTILSVFLLTTLLCANSCEKNSSVTTTQLPPETQTGAFTFGCKVEGKIVTANGKGGLLADEKVGGGGPNSDTSIIISASNSKQEFNFNLSVKFSGTTGLSLTAAYPYKGIFQDDAGGTIPGNSNTYYTDSLHLGKVNIKYFNGSINPLQTSTIVAGTFEMDAVNANGKTIHITEGRFDIGK
jgi:hypothetical protein